VVGAGPFIRQRPLMPAVQFESWPHSPGAHEQGSSEPVQSQMDRPGPRPVGQATPAARWSSGVRVPAS